MKVRLTQNALIPDTPNHHILSATGDYDLFDFIEFYAEDNPGVSLGSYQAQFAKLGGVVYREQEYTDLLLKLNLLQVVEPTDLQLVLRQDQSSTVIDVLETPPVPQRAGAEVIPQTAPVVVDNGDGTTPEPQKIVPDGQTGPVLVPLTDPVPAPTPTPPAPTQTPEFPPATTTPEVPTTPSPEAP